MQNSLNLYEVIVSKYVSKNHKLEKKNATTLFLWITENNYASMLLS